MKKGILFLYALLLSALFLRADANLPAADVLSGKPGLAVYQSKVRDCYDGKFAVYIPATYDGKTPLPLVVSAHGSGANGEKEVTFWPKFAEKYQFIVVCPPYKSSVENTPENIAVDNRMLKDVMPRVLASLKINRKRVLATGISGGGLCVWYVDAKHPEWFTALATRSGNFGDPPGINPARWTNRPIYVEWGTRDHPHILTEGPQMIDYIEHRVHCTKFTHLIIPGGGHDNRADLASAWFAGLPDAK